MAIKDDWMTNRKFTKVLALFAIVNGLFLMSVGVLASYYVYFANKTSLQVSRFIKKPILLTLSALYQYSEYSHFTWNDLLMRRNLCVVRIIQSFALGLLFLGAAYYMNRVLKKSLTC
jgi:hypothetical protein